MRVTLIEDGIYGKDGDIVDIGYNKAKEMGLIPTNQSVTTTKFSKTKTK